MQTPLAMCYRQLELNPKNLHDLQNNQVSTKETYFNKMSRNTTDCGLWGDLITIFWISQYLQRSIYVCYKMSARIMMECEEEYNPTFLMHLAFGN